MTDDEDEDEMEDLDALAKGLDHKPKAASAAETGDSAKTFISHVGCSLGITRCNVWK